MIFSRALALLLSALTVFFSPGPQAWAQTASINLNGSGKPIQAAPVVSQISLPGQAGLDLGFAPGSLKTGVLPQTTIITPNAARPKVGSVSAQTEPVLNVPIAVGVKSAPIQTPAVPLIGKTAQTPKAAQAAALQEKAAALTEGAAPILKTLSSPEASPDSLRKGGHSLQSVLEGGKAAPAVELDLQPAVESNNASFSRSGLARPEDSKGKEAGQRTPAPAPELSPEQKSKFRSYSGAVAAVKVGIETLNLAVPLLLLSTLHAAVAISALYLAAELAGLFAGLLGGALVDRIGAGRSMALMAFVQAAAIAALPAALAAGGALAMPVVYGLFILNGVAGELFEVARRSAMPLIVGRDEGRLRKYNGGLYIWREIAATAGVFGAGWFLHSLGAMATIWVHPAFCLAAGLALLRFWRDLKARAEPAHAAAEERVTYRQTIKGWFSDVVRGAKIVLLNKKLRTIVLVNIPLNAVHKIFHTLIAIIYAAKVLGNPAMAAVLLGAWNLGELAGAWYLERRGRESRISSWLRLAAGASLSMWAYWLFPTPFVAIPVSFLIAAAMIGNEIGTASYMQASIPERDLGSVTGFVYAFARAIAMLGLFLSGLLFDSLGPMNGFLAMAVLFSVIAPIYFFASRSFRDDKTGDVAPMDD